MEKKQALINLLTHLKPYFPLAEGLLMILKRSHVDENFLDGLSSVIEKSIDYVSDQKAKEKLEASLSQIKKIQQQEKILRDEEDGEINILLQNAN